MGKVLGLDLGTNSIGISLRNQDNGGDLKNQLEYFGVSRFQEGVGKNKSGEYSYAAERTQKRSTRRLYQSRKYRIWRTLEVLINHNLCPLSIEDLDKWRKYDKSKGLKRQYPTYAVKFEQWVRLDFNGDGVADYSSPYQLRAELMTIQYDFSKEEYRFKLGRALYHIAQRRGFKSSKGETIKEQENKNDEDIDLASALKQSEEKKSKGIEAFMADNNLPTVGCAYYELEKRGIRIRKSEEFQAVRSQYKKEIVEIFKFQNGLDLNSDLYKQIISERKGEGSIFYKRPLRSQKGLVGKCTLEPAKARCPISHPDFETYRAWCFINNIRYRKTSEDEWQVLDITLKNELFNTLFLRQKISFKFEEIRKWIEKKIGQPLSKKGETINYKDNTNVSGCPVCARLKNILGENWQNVIVQTNKERINKKTGEVHTISYNYEDIWHIAFSFEDIDCLNDLMDKLNFDEKQKKQMLLLMSNIQQGYSTLCLKAIKSINRFLTKGLIYTDSVLLAKLPEIMGNEKWQQVEDKVMSKVREVIENNRKQKDICKVTNTLIANYKSLDQQEQFAYKNNQYKLDDSDIKDVDKVLCDYYGAKTWNEIPALEQKNIKDIVTNLYQQFFASNERKYYEIPTITTDFAKYLCQEIKDISTTDLNKLYHPSDINYYTPSKSQIIEDGRSVKLLGSPVIGALKNPMAMRMLHTLRKQINAMLKTKDQYGNPLIDENTRIVVETAREMNDANMRWAVEKYQELRANENKFFEERLKEIDSTRAFNDTDIDNVRLMLEQQNETKSNKVVLSDSYDKIKKAELEKYRLWNEQNCICIYTGKVINLSNLFDENAFDFEHTIPRSVVFDNSLANQTVCDAYYNRYIKKNQIPTALPNYDKDVTINGKTYTAIKPRLESWKEKVEKLQERVEFWKGQSKRATDKERKDFCIRQRHLWSMELEYWGNKLSRFTMTEVKQGFRNSQLVDTRIISKYAFHYLKTVFNLVDVQKGSMTADFRKMLGVQSVDEKKNRNKHSHHAIDATILTLIPSAAKRDKMVKMFYELEERKKNGDNSDAYKKICNDFAIELKQCGIKGADEITEFIENNILINHISKDQTLAPAHRRKRAGGKIVWKRDKNGNFVLDENGDKMPIWITGDCIRGQLHGETFYGAITQAEKDEKGKILRNEDGNIKVGDEIFYVVRRELKYKANQNDSGFKDWEELSNSIVNKDLIEIFKKQFPEGISFKDACAEGIYMLDRNGEKINKVRHVRCRTSVKKPLVIKKQTYLSNKSYKQNYYAEMGDLYVMCKYQSEDLICSEFVIYSLFDISFNRKLGIEDLPHTITNKKGNTLLFKYALHVGDMVLIYEKNKEELLECDNNQISNKLYVVRGFESDGNRIILQKHINSQKDGDLGKGESVKNYQELPQKIRCSIGKVNLLVKGIHFNITTNGQIAFI